MGQEAARRGRHRRPVTRRGRPRRRRAGRRRRRRSPQAPEAALPVAGGGVRRRRLRPARGPAGLLPARPDADRGAPARGHDRLRPPSPGLGGGEDARLARPLAPPRPGLRGAARGLRGYGQAGHDPAHAAPPRPSEPEAVTRSLTSQTASQSFATRPSILSTSASAERAKSSASIASPQSKISTVTASFTRRPARSRAGVLTRNFSNLPRSS